MHRRAFAALFGGDPRRFIIVFFSRTRFQLIVGMGCLFRADSSQNSRKSIVISLR
jgi:hypothetical protein